MTTAAVAPSLEDFQRAREIVSRAAQPTPMQTSRFLTELTGASQVYMKCENLQRTGSYKLRGAYHRMSQLSEAERAAGVVAASAGNHAQGVAFAARELGIKATIFMPKGVALPKLQATRNYGADVVLHGHSVEEALRGSREFAAASGAVIIPPFDHLAVIEGQGTIALEMLDEAPEIDTFVVPIGGGGLIAGIAVAAKQRAALTGQPMRIIGVQAENAACYPASLAAGEPVTVETLPTIADGIAVAHPGELNFDIIREYVDEVVTVTEDDLARAILLLLERAKLMVEPAGAAGVAAMVAGKIHGSGTVATVLSGGNIDPMLLQRVISHGLAASNRYLKIRVMLPDRPGQLARTAELVSEANANVVEVQHTRHGSGLQINEVELELHIETRGEDHRDEVVQKLRDAGYRLEIISR